MPKNIGYLFLSLAALMWGSTAAISKLLLADLNNLQVLFYANLFSFLGLFLIVIFQKRKVAIKSYVKKDYFTFAWMGFIGIFLYNFFLFGALQLLPAQEAFIINYLWPIMVVIFAFLILKEPITTRKVFGICLSFFGVAIVAAKGNFFSLNFSSVPGILSAVSGAITYGLFSVIGKRLNYDKFISMMFYYLFSVFYSLATVLIFSEIPPISFYQILGLIWLGAFVNGLGFVFWFLALKHGDIIKMSNLIFLTPFLSLVYIFFLVGEKILFSSIIGLIVIMTGIIIQSRQKLPGKRSLNI